MTTENESLNPSHMRTGRLEFDTAMVMVAITVSAMGTCRRRAVGCVLTKDRHIVATGYNGAPRGLPHCLDAGCLVVDGHCVRCSHAEANACLRCLEADTAYCSDTPCLTCLKLLLQKGVRRVFAWRSYHDPATDAFVAQNFPPGETPIYRVRGELLEAMENYNRGLEAMAYVLGDV